jgi:hypothetical protein
MEVLHYKIQLYTSDRDHLTRIRKRTYSQSIAPPDHSFQKSHGGIEITLLMLME